MKWSRRTLALLCLAGGAVAAACGQFLGVDDDGPSSSSGGASVDASLEATKIIEITADSGITIEESNDAAPPAPCANVDLTIDPKNCGTCGQACRPEQTCSGGTCRAGLQCLPNEISCGTSLGDVACVNPSTDKNNCGACANACNFGCVDARCEKLVFVTTNAFTVNAFGGVAGADIRCQTIANNAGRKGQFLAWISDETTSPKQRFTIDGGAAYRLPDGKMVASNAKDLVLHGPSTGIDETITGQVQPNTAVWTNTDPTGATLGNPCNNWSTPSQAKVAVGNTSAANNGDWTNTGGGGGGACSKVALLYCFEQER